MLKKTKMSKRFTFALFVPLCLLFTSCQVLLTPQQRQQLETRVYQAEYGNTYRAARDVMIPENYVQRMIQFAEQGFTEIQFKEFNTDWDSEAYLTVSGQNSNNTVRVTNEFLEAVISGADWELTSRTNGGVMKTLNARDSAPLSATFRASSSQSTE